MVSAEMGVVERISLQKAHPFSVSPFTRSN